MDISLVSLLRDFAELQRTIVVGYGRSMTDYVRELDRRSNKDGGK
jgi:hypothetical protein